MEDNKIYVGNIPYSLTEDQLRNAFQRFGSIDEALIIMDRQTRRSKGFGFVKFADSSSAQAALEMNGKEIEGRSVRVSLARSKET